MTFTASTYVNLVSQATAVEIREFEAAFARLAKRDQHLLLLVGVEGFSYEEVAEVFSTDASSEGVPGAVPKLDRQ